MGVVAQSGLPLNVLDAYKHPAFNKAVDLSSGYRTQSVLCYPLVEDSTVLGVVQVMRALSLHDVL